MALIIAGAALVLIGLVFAALKNAADKVAAADATIADLRGRLADSQAQAELNAGVAAKVDQWRAAILSAQAKLAEELDKPLPAPIVRIISRTATDGGSPLEAEIIDFQPVITAHRERVERVRHIAQDAVADTDTDSSPIGPA